MNRCMYDVWKCNWFECLSVEFIFPVPFYARWKRKCSRNLAFSLESCNLLNPYWKYERMNSYDFCHCTFNSENKLRHIKDSSSFCQLIKQQHDSECCCTWISAEVWLSRGGWYSVHQHNLKRYIPLYTTALHWSTVISNNRLWSVLFIQSFIWLWRSQTNKLWFELSR